MLRHSVQLIGDDGAVGDDCCDGGDDGERVDDKDRKLHTLSSIYLDVPVCGQYG